VVADNSDCNPVAAPGQKAALHSSPSWSGGLEKAPAYKDLVLCVSSVLHRFGNGPPALQLGLERGCVESDEISRSNETTSRNSELPRTFRRKPSLKKFSCHVFPPCPIALRVVHMLCGSVRCCGWSDGHTPRSATERSLCRVESPVFIGELWIGCSTSWNRMKQNRRPRRIPAHHTLESFECDAISVRRWMRPFPEHCDVSGCFLPLRRAGIPRRNFLV
jgi:hypothetical protein